MKFQKVIHKRGFTAVPTTYYKPDPRGAEYGQFTITRHSPIDTRVSHSLHGYTIRFDNTRDLDRFLRAHG